ncbi:hypothetical protein K9M59_00460 [Candidatus Gracilibacteria bacterium]|nr:hypothetical protein [Candidatus Gracilibacteria bacterium]MCF7819053.1 hypothetical protein [Candidatus Gracilibacteria bacterium]
MSGSGFSGTGYTGCGSVKLAEDRLIFLPKNRAWFFWDPSPISLTNSGGIIQILNEQNEVLDQIQYLDTKSGTYQRKDYADVWNRHEKKENILFPLTVREEGSMDFQPTPGEKNKNAPTFSEDIELLISEVSPDRDPAFGFDFLELFVRYSSEDPINLKYLEIKHNGTQLFFAEQDFWVQQGDYIVAEFNNMAPALVRNSNPHRISTNARNNISAGSGTIEVILYSGTGWERNEDFVCWKDGELSQTEQSRVEKQIDEGNWSGACIDIANLISNESLARIPLGKDTNTKSDFFRHFNGSEGVENTSHNNAPQALISVQGGHKIFRGWLNFTGENSTDPDGSHDIKSFLWTINEESCPSESAGWYWKNNCTEESVRSNPDTLYFEKLGDYTIQLQVTDFSETTSTHAVVITVTEQGIDPFGIGFSGGAENAFSGSLKRWLQQELKKESPYTEEMRDQQARSQKFLSSHFFEKFLDSVSPQWLHLMEKRAQKIQKREVLHFDQDLSHWSFSQKFENQDPQLFQWQKISPDIQKRALRNIGIIFEQ